MAKSLVDANILLRLILQDAPALARRAVAIVGQADFDSLVVSPVIAAEVLYVLAAKSYSREQSVDGLLLLINRSAFAQNQLLNTSLGYYSQTKLDYADCYLLARALAGNLGLHSLDIKLQKAHQRLQASDQQN